MFKKLIFILAIVALISITPALADQPYRLAMNGQRNVAENQTMVLSLNARDDNPDHQANLTFFMGPNYVNREGFKILDEDDFVQTSPGIFEWQTDYFDEGNYYVSYGVTDPDGLSRAAASAISVIHVDNPLTRDADFNHDGVVDEADTELLFGDLFRNQEPFDLDNDGVFGIDDNFIFIDQLGERINDLTFNTLPVFSTIGNQSVNEGDTLTFSVSAADVDGDGLTYDATSLPDGATFIGTVFTYTPDFTVVRTTEVTKTFEVTFAVNDGTDITLETIDVVVSNTNRAPVLGGIGSRNIDEREVLTFPVSASDPDEEDELSFLVSGLPEGATFENQEFTWTPSFSQEGTYSVTFTTTDGDLTDEETITITVANLEVSPDFDGDGDVDLDDFFLFADFFGTENVEFDLNQDGIVNILDFFLFADDFGESPVINNPPVFEPIEDRTVDEGEFLSFVLLATDEDDDNLVYSSLGLPPGARLIGTTFDWTPDFNQAGSHTMIFNVEDGNGGEDSITVTITVFGNENPILSPIANFAVTEGDLVSITLSAEDPDDDPLTFTAEGLPIGSNLIDNAFTWIPSFTQAGTHQIEFTVSDDNGNSDSETVIITVGNINQGPAINMPDVIKVNEGQEIVIEATAFDVDGDSITFTLDDARFTQETNTRFTLATDFNDEGFFFVTLTATTADGKTESKTLKIEIKNTKIDHPDVRVEEAVAVNPGGVVHLGEPLELYINVRNDGNTDNEDTKIILQIPSLKIYQDLGIFSLDKGDKFLDLTEVDLGNDVVPGEEYYFIVTAESRDAKDIQYGSFMVV